MPRFVLLLLLAALGLAACAPLVTDVPSPMPTAIPPGDWSLHMTQAGGIMGLRRSVVISNGGQLSVTDERAGRTVTLQLADDDLVRLESLLAQMDYLEVRSPAVCADCFVYDLSLERGDGRPWSVTLDDMSLDGSGLADLVGFVRTLMDEALKN